VGVGWSANYDNAIIRASLAHRLKTTQAVSDKTEQHNFLLQVGWVFQNSVLKWQTGDIRQRVLSILFGCHKP